MTDDMLTMQERLAERQELERLREENARLRRELAELRNPWAGLTESALLAHRAVQLQNMSAVQAAGFSGLYMHSPFWPFA